MMRFDDLCRMGISCELCRDLERGRAWRQSAIRVFELPGLDVDFTCPHGKPWGFAGDGARPAGRVNAPASRSHGESRRERAARRLAICKRLDCEELGNICEARFPDGVCSGGFQSWLADPRSECPRGHWQKEL